MKKFTLLAAVLAMMAGNLAAQYVSFDFLMFAKQGSLDVIVPSGWQCDSTLSFDADDYLFEKVIYAHDETGAVLDEESFGYYEGKEYIEEKIVYNYDDQGRLARTETWDFGFMNDEANLTDSMVYVYEEGKLKTLFIYAADEIGDPLELKMKIEISLYGENGQPHLADIFMYVMGGWYNIGRGRVSYNDNGQVVNVNYNINFYTLQMNDDVTVEYDEIGNVIKSVLVDDDGEWISEFEYIYDDLNRVQERAEIEDGELECVTKYFYSVEGTPPGPGPGPGPAVPGDANGDGSVDGSDVNLVINMILGKTDKDMKADVNGDGNVDGSDINVIINIILGK